MKVILLENLIKIGSIGDIIDVKRGFARNYLISNKKALYASKENIKEVEKIKSFAKNISLHFALLIISSENFLFFFCSRKKVTTFFSIKNF